MVRCVRSSDQQDFSHGYIDQLRLPMLTIPSKQGVTVDLTSVLAELIWTEFGEDPTHFRQEVREFNQLRESAIRPSRDNNVTSTVRRVLRSVVSPPHKIRCCQILAAGI